MTFAFSPRRTRRTQRLNSFGYLKVFSSVSSASSAVWFSCLRVFVAKGLTFVSLVSLVSFVSFALATPQALHAQMSGAPTAGYKREPGITSSTMPAALREIGFDQFIDRSIPLDVPFRDEAGRTVQLGDYFGGRSSSSSRTTTVPCSARGDQRAFDRTQCAFAGTERGFRNHHRQLQPEGYAGNRRGEEGHLPRAVQTQRRR